MTQQNHPRFEETERRARAALVVAHPGHELRVYGWLAATRPRVFVLTDGSGRSNVSRLGSTSRLLTALGSERGSIYGRLTDASLYAAILNRDFQLFTGLADELAATLAAERVELVVGDAAEGGNPGHDACRLIVNAAVRLAERAAGARIANFPFPLGARPDDCPAEARPAATWLRLDDETFARKLRAARDYPEVTAEVEAAFNGAGSAAMRDHPDLAARSGINTDGMNSESFRTECLRPVARGEWLGGAFDEEPPFYEHYGERQVAAGFYERVLRYREHMLPLAEALRSHCR